MTTKLALNGFGRIGRSVIRALIETGRKDLEIIAINDLASDEDCAYLLEFDSIHGRFKSDVSLTGDILNVNDHKILMTSERDPAALPWANVDIVLECTGIFKSPELAGKHLENGSKKVLISAPAKNIDRTIVYGVNHSLIKSDDLFVSNASCTTNCLAPVVQVLNDTFGIETGYMTTVHSFTGSQPTHDRQASDPRRGRAAGISMVPTTTGAAKALSLVLPEIEGKLEGSAIRVPTPNVSCIDLTFMPTRPATVEQVNAAMTKAAEGYLKDVLGVCDKPLVSVDFMHDPRSSIFALDQTTVTQGGMIRVLSWYDNEWGFSNRMLDTASVMATA